MPIDWSADNWQLSDWFPDGLTVFGVRHVIPDNQFGRVSEEKMNVEYECELIRRRFYPGKPSRLQSVFALASLQDAVHFRNGLLEELQRESEIWEVEAGPAQHRGDMRMIDPAHFNEHVLRRYWEGQHQNDLPPIWELLLSPPVQLVRQVE